MSSEPIDEKHTAELQGLIVELEQALDGHGFAVCAFALSYQLVLTALETMDAHRCDEHPKGLVYGRSEMGLRLATSIQVNRALERMYEDAKRFFDETTDEREAGRQVKH